VNFVAGVGFRFFACGFRLIGGGFRLLARPLPLINLFETIAPIGRHGKLPLSWRLGEGCRRLGEKPVERKTFGQIIFWRQTLERQQSFKKRFAEIRLGDGHTR